MTAEQFIYWLKGLITGVEYLDEDLVDVIHEELNKVVLPSNEVAPRAPFNATDPLSVNSTINPDGTYRVTVDKPSPLYGPGKYSTNTTATSDQASTGKQILNG